MGVVACLFIKAFSRDLSLFNNSINILKHENS